MMFDQLKTALGQAETKSDTAVVLGAGTLGFVVDGIASVHGVFSPGTVSALSATGALAAKKGWEARRDAKRAEKVAERVRGRVGEMRPRAVKLVDFFQSHGYEAGAAALSTQLDWHEQEIIDDDQLGRATEEARRDFLDWARKSPQFAA